MHLRFAYLTSRVELKHNSLFCDEFEQATDILNSYVRDGYTLLSAYLVDEGQQIRLPIHAFDGELVGESVHHLQEEWQQILYL